MATKLSAHEEPVHKVFSSDYRFSIPLYQRPYSWAKEHALQLLDDLTTALDSDQTEPYFLGSVVLVDKGNAEFDVIDGQQRLTTLTILLAVLRDLTEVPDIAKAIEGHILEPGQPLRGLKSQPRLTLREQDAEYFRTYVQTTGRTAELTTLTDAKADTEPKQAIRDNASAMRAVLEKRSDEKRQALASLISDRTLLVVVQTPDLSSAYRIFSVMNARGLDLAPTDVFKSQVLGEMPGDARLAKAWEETQDALGRDDFTDMFRDIRTIVNGKRAEKELLQEFPEQVLMEYLNNSQAEEFVDEIVVPYGQAMESIQRSYAGPETEWSQVNAWLRRLSMIDNKDWRPIALWVLREHADQPKVIAPILQRLEHLAASMLLGGVYTTPRVARYLDVLADLKAGLGAEARNFDLTDDEKRWAREALDGDIYRMQIKRARYVLLRLDELMANNPGVTYEHDIVSIEHVLPRNPAAGSSWMKLFSEDDRKAWTDRLGNLLLLNHRKNSQANNREFGRKKSTYFNSKGSAIFALTTDVLKHEEWTPTVLAERQAYLTQKLIAEWGLD